MERKTYIRHVLSQHLCDDKGTYQQLTEREALSRIAAVKIRMGKIVAGKLPVQEQKYFTSNLISSTKSFRLPQTYGMPKVHKGEDRQENLQ